MEPFKIDMKARRRVILIFAVFEASRDCTSHEVGKLPRHGHGTSQLSPRKKREP